MIECSIFTDLNDNSQAIMTDQCLSNVSTSTKLKMCLEKTSSDLAEKISS